MTKKFQHASLAARRWFKEFSFADQMGNIGSEIHRTLCARGDEKRYQSAVERGLELFELTMSDPRWEKHWTKIATLREHFYEAACGSNKYPITLEDLDRYFYHFASASQLAKWLRLDSQAAEDKALSSRSVESSNQGIDICPF
jgi:hypothetical protein